MNVLKNNYRSLYLILTFFISVPAHSYQIWKPTPPETTHIDIVQKKISSAWNSIPFDLIQAKIIAGWNTIPDNVKEYTIALGSTVIVAYVTAKVFHIIFKESVKIAWYIYQPRQIKETFDDIAGLHEAKNSLQSIIDFLDNPTVFKNLGAKLPHGILLTGSPGNGKTLLARAMAGQAQCHFISVCGSDFVEMYVGVGSARIKELFTTARKLAPCIIFIDEIDALARSRSSFQANQEYDLTLNQLLKELDGFESKDNKTVIVLAATNDISLLDAALIRAGRFDRIIHIDNPDLQTRKEILQLHLKNINSSNIDLVTLAQQTSGFSGAALANLINQAAILAAQKKLSVVSMLEFQEALYFLTQEQAHLNSNKNL